MWTRRTLTASLLASAAEPFVSAAGAAATRTVIVPFQTSPFPYNGLVPDSGRPFLDTTQGEEPAHTSPRGGAYTLSSTYNDRSVLISIPPRFTTRRQAAFVLFLHGNLAKLDRDVVERQQVVAQFAASHLDAVLIAPQFAVDALDSSAGHFWDAEGYARFMVEAADRVARMTGIPFSKLAELPVVLVAYSGGHNPAAYILMRRTSGPPVAGVVLLDALFDYVRVFADWLARNNGRGFFFSAFSKSSADGNHALEADLTARGIAFSEGLPAQIAPGTVAFLDAGETVDHNDFVTRAWADNPLQAVLSRVDL